MAVMVTGIGHVGSYIVRGLLDAGESVVLFGLFGGPGGPNAVTPDLHVLERVIGADYADRIQIHVGDVRDLANLIDVAQTYDVTKVIHLASMLSAAAESNPPLAVQVNSVGFANIFEMAARQKFDKVVWASSIDVFGDGSVDETGTIRDDAPYDPAFIYGGTKVLGEYLARGYAQNFGLSITGLRLSRVYGFGEHIKASRGGGSSWLSGLLYEPAVASGKEVLVPFGGRMMDFLYLEDAASAFLKALDTPAPGSRNYLTCGTYRQVSDAYEFVHGLFPDAPIRLDMADAPLPAGSSMVWRNRFDGSRAARDFGYSGQFSLEEGLLQTINENRATVDLPPVSSPR